MTVETWRREKETLIGQMRWAAVPDVSFELHMTTGGQLVEFRARTDDGVSARRLREAPIGRMQRVLRQHVTESARTLADSEVPVFLAIGKDGSVTPIPDPGMADVAQDWPALRQRMRKLAADFADRPRPGAAGRGDDRYAAVAQMYVELLDAGEQHPVKVLAGQLLLGDKTVRNLLYKARERGLLTSAGRGQAGGQLTDKAKEILDGQH